MFSCHLLPVVDKIFFRRFGMSCFVCIVLPFVDISLIFLVLASTFCFIISSCMVIFPVFPFPFCSYIFQRLFFVLSYWPVFVDFFFFFFAFQVEVSILALTFLSCFLRVFQFSSKSISLLHRLVHLIWLY